MSISNWPSAERPREKLLLKGADALSDAELLAIFLRTGVPGKTALDLAREMLSFHGSLRALLKCDHDAFCSFKGMGSAKYAQLQASLEMSKRYFKDELREADVLTSSESAKRFIALALRDKPSEVFACLYLDTQHRVLAFEELFQGTLDAASVYPREVVRRVIDHRAAAVIFCHNHPSGSQEPSQADILITRRLAEALKLIDVRVLDHFIVAGQYVSSFAERGLL